MAERSSILRCNRTTQVGLKLFIIAQRQLDEKPVPVLVQVLAPLNLILDNPAAPVDDLPRIVRLLRVAPPVAGVIAVQAVRQSLWVHDANNMILRQEIQSPEFLKAHGNESQAVLRRYYEPRVFAVIFHVGDMIKRSRTNGARLPILEQTRER